MDGGGFQKLLPDLHCLQSFGSPRTLRSFQYFLARLSYIPYLFSCSILFFRNEHLANIIENLNGAKDGEACEESHGATNDA